jgi:GNAT superfamily N-acetyltransferase
MMGGEAAGCAAIRPFGERDCEKKRLYVRPAHRGKGVGKRLAATAVEVATQLGYRHMLLDTLASMTDATRLYRSLGFVETEPYTFNPLPDVLYFALDL